MCGLAGIYNASGNVKEQDVLNMTRALKHRGPDAEGFHSEPECVLGHRRLSIIDLNERSNQPMWSSCGRYVMVYNGEVYNFNEVGARLQNQPVSGQPFRLKTSGDSEVVLEAFAKYGESFVEMLNGMFAIAIYDTRLKTLHIFRDRLGIKPVFYYYKDGVFAFASEIKALKTLRLISNEYSTEAIAKFMQVGYIPAPLSIYKDIYKLPGGCSIRVDGNGINVNRYWDIEDHIATEPLKDENSAVVRLSDLIMSSVQYQLRSDVPFGVFLSGGIDSSLIAAQSVMMSSTRISTFSIGFKENRFNELEYAGAVAKYLGTDHHEFVVTYDEALKLIGSVVDVYDEPFADSSCIPTMLVSKLARQHVTVTLSGEGGDELFFGYGSHVWARRLSNPVTEMMLHQSRHVLSSMSSRYKRIGKLLDYSDSDNLMQHVFSQEQYLFTRSETNAMLERGFSNGSTTLPEFANSTKNYSYDFFEKASRNGKIGRNLTRMEMQALYDLNCYLQDDLLTKVDRASMHYSLEARVPYLDHRLVELAVNISPHLKYRKGITKYILKEILYQYLPEMIFKRPKQGFAIPLGPWLKNELRSHVDQYLSESEIKKYNVFKWQEVKQLLDRFYGGEDFLFNRVWVLYIAQQWLDRNQ